jgi:hypothetical protein
MKDERADIAPDQTQVREDWKMVGLRRHFSNTEALIEALEEMERVLRRPSSFQTQSGFGRPSPPEL